MIIVTSRDGRKAYSPTQDRKIDVAGPLGTTVIGIKGGRAWVVSSPCPGKTCVRAGRTGPGDGPVVCLPNEVSVSFEANGGCVDAYLR